MGFYSTHIVDHTHPGSLISLSCIFILYWWLCAMFYTHKSRGGFWSRSDSVSLICVTKIIMYQIVASVLLTCCNNRVCLSRDLCMIRHHTQPPWIYHIGIDLHAAHWIYRRSRVHPLNIRILTHVGVSSASSVLMYLIIIPVMPWGVHMMYRWVISPVCYHGFMDIIFECCLHLWIRGYAFACMNMIVVIGAVD